MFVRKITIFRKKDFSEEYREQLLEYAYNLYLQNGANSLNYIVTTLQEWSDKRGKGNNNQF